MTVIRPATGAPYVCPRACSTVTGELLRKVSKIASNQKLRHIINNVLLKM